MQHPVACRDIQWLQADMPERAPIGKFTCFFEAQFTPENQFETRKSTRLEFKMGCRIVRIGGECAFCLGGLLTRSMRA